jgi:hypothetical protein
MVKSEMVMLTEREKADLVDADVTVDWMLMSAIKALVGDREKESWCGVGEIEIHPIDHWNQP